MLIDFTIIAYIVIGFYMLLAAAFATGGYFIISRAMPSFTHQNTYFKGPYRNRKKLRQISMIPESA